MGLESVLKLSDGREFDAEIGTVESTHLGFEDHGGYSWNINFVFGGSGQGTGHRYITESRIVDVQTGRREQVVDLEGAGLWLEVLKYVGDWESLVGRQFWVLRSSRANNAMIVGLVKLVTRGVSSSASEPLIFDDAYAKAVSLA